MNTELTLLITRSANIYIWIFIIFFIIQFLHMFTKAYKIRQETLEKLGKIENGFSITNFITWFLFILSMYYK